MNLGDAVLTLRVDDQGLSKGLDSAKQKADGLTGSLKTLVAGFATFATVREVVKILRDCFNSFIENEMAAAKLTGALRATGQEYLQTSKNLQAFASSMQKVSIYSDEAIMGAEAMLIQLSNLSEEGVKEAIPVVMDLAAAMGMDLESAATLVAKALEGNVGALGRYGIKIKSSQDPTEQFDTVIQALTEHFGGMAVALGKTTGGELEKFKNQVDEAKESVGGFLASFVRGYVQWGRELGDALKTVWWYLQQTWAVWTDITNLRNPFGKDSQANLLVMAERQKQLTEQMAIWEGMQAAAFSAQKKQVAANREQITTYRTLAQTVDDVGVEHGKLRTAYEDDPAIIGDATTALDEQTAALADLAAQAEYQNARMLAAVMERNEKEREENARTAAEKKKEDDEELRRQQEIAALVVDVTKSAFEEIGRDLAAGELSWASLGETALAVIGKIVTALGDELAASAAADLVKGMAALASIFGAPAAPGFFASAAIKLAGAAAAWVAGSALQSANFKTGGEFTVPPGYENDSYRMGVSSGEEVSVTPSGSEGDMIHVVVNLDSGPILDAVTRGSRRRRVLIAARSVVP